MLQKFATEDHPAALQSLELAVKNYEVFNQVVLAFINSLEIKELVVAYRT